MGAGNAQIVFSGILPNSMAPLVVQGTLTLATAILDVAAPSFLSLGARAPSPERGAMLTDAFRSGFGVFIQGQHAIIFPGITIALSVLSVNLSETACATPWILAAGDSNRRGLSAAIAPSRGRPGPSLASAPSPSGGCPRRTRPR